MSDASPALHGPGGLLGTPGLGAPRKGRKWGQRLKDSGYSARAGQTIRGNLARGGDGKFTAAGNASAAKPKRGIVLSKQPKPKITPVKAAPKPKRRSGGKGRAAAKPKAPKATPEQRQAERDQERSAKQAANRKAVADALANADASLGPTGVNAVLAAAGGGPIVNGAALQKLGYAEQNPDGSYRLTSEARALASAADRGDTRAALDADGRAQERAKKRSDADAKRAAAEAKKLEPKAEPEKASGGGSKKPSDAEKRTQQAQERAKRTDATAAQVGLLAADVQALRQGAEAGGASSPALAALGLIGADGMTTDQGRRALSALERGDVRQYQAALQDAKARMGREAAAQDRRQQTDARRSTAAQERQAKQRQQIERLKRRALAGGRLSDAQRAQLEDAGVMDATGRWTGKAFAVFKDHRGQYRWLARTTTAYRDRDGEIISEAALDADSQRMMATKQFGPLRWWHVGDPDPANAAAPWGPGLDIGDCDYSVVIGRTRIESGTFRDPVIAQKCARVADKLEMSPGFFHPLDQPDAAKVFNSIRTFERSPVPTRYGRASNLFTGFTVKEFHMEVAEMERRFKAMYQELGLTPEQGLELGQQLVTTEKAAAAQGIAFKSEEQPAPEPEAVVPAAEPIYYHNDQPGIISGGQWIALKAAPPMAEEAPVAVETQADGMVDELVEEVVTPDEPSGQYVGDLTPDEFFARLDEHLAPLIKMQDMVKSLSDGVGELKSMSSGTATKEAGVSAELTALKAQQQALADQIAQIEGRQPATILPSEVEEAFKSAGPSVPASPEDAELAEVVNDPSRPFAGIAARTMPALYKTNADGAFAGWTPPPPV